jgi:glycosyltransferase involved in cell wall biosynthesis
VLDIHLMPANPLGVVAGLVKSRPTMITVYQTMGMERWLYWLSGQFNLCMADRLLTDSEAQRESIRRWTLRRCTAWVIPNGTSLSESGYTPGEMRTLLGLSADPRLRIIGQISGLIRYKGQMVLLDAAKLVLEQEPDVKFLIVGYVRGDPGYREQLEQRAAALGIAQHVKIVSYAGDIADIWNIIDIHVHASLLDSLPNAILEGMSLGKPAVVTRVGGVPEVIESEETGLIVPPGDPRALATALLRILRDPELGRRLGRAARRRYTSGFQPESMTRKLEQCFLEIAT